jgi:hypothetical protein
MEQSPPLEAESLLTRQKSILPFIEPESSLPFAQELVIGSNRPHNVSL